MKQDQLKLASSHDALLDQNQASDDQEQDSTSDTDKPLKLLLVEDNKVNQMVCLRILSRMDLSADLACNGAEALEMIDQDDYDIILMDCQMPVMDGFQATRHLRELPGAKSRIPVIAITANALAGDRQKCLHAGMSDYLSKPIKVDELKTLIEKWSSRKHGQTPDIEQAT